jgi:DMATS type aromatic prenyltransferase
LAPVFGSSLAITGYSIDAQYRHLLKIYAAIIPSLGPFPNAAGTNITWRSAIRPGPMEASVNYQGNGATLYRFTVEPTGPHAGTDADPVNDLAAAQLFQHLSHLQEGRLDLSAFGYLRPLLGVDGHEGRTHLDAIDALPCLFHTAIALDLKRDSDASYNVKLYLTPFMRAAMLATDVVSLLFDGLQHYRATTGSTIDFGHIEEFMRERQARLVLERTYVAVDCVDPRRSRMKIYTETAVTSLAEVYDFWTLGGRVAGPEIEKGFELVGKMWKALYPKPLPNGRQRDSMLVQMNWEISPDKPGRVSPKIYFTVIDDYDQYVSEAVVGLFKELGWSDQIQTHKRVEQEA